MESLSVEEYVQKLLEAGLSALEANDYATALERWNEVLAHDPDNVRAARLVSELTTVLARTRTRPTRRTSGADVEAVPESPPRRRFSTETNEVAWASASRVETESLQRLQELLGTSERDHERLRNELDVGRRENLQLRNELAESERMLITEREQLRQREQKFAEQDAHLREMERSWRESEREVAAQTMTMSAQSAEAEALKVELNVAHQRLQALQAEASARESQLRQSCAESSELREQLASAQASQMSLEARLADLRTDHQASESEHIATLTQFNTDLTLTLDKSGALQRSLDELTQSSSAQQQRLLEQLAEQNRQQQGLASERDAAHLLTNELAREIQELHTELESVRSAWIGLSQENLEKSNQYVSAEAQSGQLRERYAQLHADYTQLAAAFQEVDTRRQTLEALASSEEVSRFVMAERLTALEEQRNELAALVASAEAARDAARAERDNALSLQQEAEAQTSTLRSTAVALEGEVRVLQESAREVRSLQMLCTELDTRLTDANMKLTTLERELEDARATAVHVAFAQEVRPHSQSPAAEERQGRSLMQTPPSVIAVRDTPTQRVSHVTMIASPMGGAASFPPEIVAATPPSATVPEGESPQPASAESGDHPLWSSLDSGATVTDANAAAMSSSQRVARVTEMPMDRFSSSGPASGVFESNTSDPFSDAQALNELDDLLGALGQDAELDLPLASPSDRVLSFVLDPVPNVDLRGGQLKPAVAPGHGSAPPAGGFALFIDSAAPDSGISLLLDDARSAPPQEQRPMAPSLAPSAAFQAVMQPPSPSTGRGPRASGHEDVVPVTPEPQAVSEQADAKRLLFTMDVPLNAFLDADSGSLPPNSSALGGHDQHHGRYNDAFSLDDVPARGPRPPLQNQKPGSVGVNTAHRINDFLHRAPRIAPNAQHQLGAREAFVIGNIDGHTSFADIFDLCGLPPADTERILQSLFEQGVIDFDTDP